MRIYLPSTLGELQGDVAATARADVAASRVVHAATDALADALADPGEETDAEEVEYAALLAAADDSFVQIALDPSVPWQRVVVSLDVPDDAVGPCDLPDVAPSAVTVLRDLVSLPIASVHVDELEATRRVEAALGGDEQALESLADADLLWYGPSELTQLPGLPTTD